MVDHTLQRAPARGDSLALVALLAAAVASLAIYFVAFTRPAGLFSLEHRQGVDLLRLSRADATFRPELIAGFAALAGLYALGWWAAGRLRGSAPAWAVVATGAGLAALTLLCMYPYGATDVFDYIIRGRLTALYHLNPFAVTPRQVPIDPFFSFAAWKNSPSAYGPLWELLAAGTAWLAGDGFFANVLAFKLLSGAFAAGSAALVADLLRRSAPGRALQGVWLLAWNPLLLVETFGNAHNDMVMAFFLVAAAWAVSRRRFSLGVIALTAGALVKYIPLLLIPAAGWLALVEAGGWRERLRFVAGAGAAGLALAAAAFAPFWMGARTLDLALHTELYTTSLPAVIYYAVLPAAGRAAAQAALSAAAAGLTGVFAVWQGLRAAPRHGDPPAPAWERFARAGVNVLLFYLLLTCLWFQEWYLVWPLALAVLLPAGPLQAFVAGTSFAVLLKPLVVAPYLLWRVPMPKQAWREPRLALGVLGLPWLAAFVLLWKGKWR